MILDIPDNTSAAALAMAFAGGSTVKSCKTTPLLSIDDGIEALKRGAKAGYKPATASKTGYREQGIGYREQAAENRQETVPCSL